MVTVCKNAYIPVASLHNTVGGGAERQPRAGRPLSGPRNGNAAVPEVEVSQRCMVYNLLQVSGFIHRYGFSRVVKFSAIFLNVNDTWFT